MNYPNGKTFLKTTKVKSNNHKVITNAANRGMNLENDINLSNDFYNENDYCLITKRPTPINIVKVDYSKGARIIDAYFEKQSTTDYNGIYKGKYLDFEAKNTRNKTSFPLSNISPHQIKHLERVIKHKGIAFFIIQFEELNEVYLLDASFVIDYYHNAPRKSIPYDVFQQQGIQIKRGLYPSLNYLEAVEEKYFKN